MLKFIKKLKLKFNPPQEGDVYYADPFEFIIGKLIERRMHDLVADDGFAIWEVIPSDGCYKLTIEADSMPYYRCTGEALCKKTDGTKTEWKKRRQPRRIWKEQLHDMIISGRLKKI